MKRLGEASQKVLDYLKSARTATRSDVRYAFRLDETNTVTDDQIDNALRTLTTNGSVTKVGKSYVVPATTPTEVVANVRTVAISGSITPTVSAVIIVRKNTYMNVHQYARLLQRFVKSRTERFYFSYGNTVISVMVTTHNPSEIVEALNAEMQIEFKITDSVDRAWEIVEEYTAHPLDLEQLKRRVENYFSQYSVTVPTAPAVPSNITDVWKKVAQHGTDAMSRNDKAALKEFAESMVAEDDHSHRD